MWTPKKSVKLSIILTDIFILLLIIGAVSLPWVVTWYVEYKHRAASLPTTIMLTCYPCVPFAAVVLGTLRKILKSVQSGDIFTVKNCERLKRISWCCYIVTAVMLVAGRFYLPFYVSAACTAFIGLILRIIKNILETNIEKEEIKTE